MLVIFVSAVVPVRIAFEDVVSVTWKVADYLMDFVFFVDIIVNFMTAIETENGEFVKDRK